MNSIHSAYKLIKDRLAGGEWAQGERLPSLAALSESCGVSRTTMWKAVALLKSESLVFARERGAIIAGMEGVPDFDASAKSAWQRVKSRLGQELLQGVYIVPELPPINKLALRHGVAIETMKKALRGLVLDGILERTGRRYVQARKDAVVHPPVIALISKGEKEQESLIADHRTLTLFESLERECLRIGYQSRSEGFNDRSPNGLIDFVSRFKGIFPLKGCIVNVLKPFDETFWGRWLDLLKILANRKVPVIVIDQEGALALPGELLSNPNFRIFRISAVRAGEIVASSLLRRGHRQLAFVAPFYGYSWAQNRYRGLKRFCARYGGPQVKVDLFKLDAPVDHQDLEWGLLGLDIKEIRTLFKGRYSAGELEDIRLRLERTRGGEPPEKIAGNRAVGMIRNFALYLKKVIGREHDAAIYETMLKTLGVLSSNKAEEMYLRPFFERVLAHGRGATWVCVNDDIAVYALTFLARAGMKVPGDISVAGFDNSYEAYKTQLSSYDFNMNGMVQKALQMFLDEKAFRNSAVVSEVDGYVVERRTTRK